MIKLGHIDYLNCLPLTYVIQQGLPKDFKIEAKVPAQLNAAVLAGELDVSPVSSILYAANHQHLDIIPDVSINTDGVVQSILLVSKKPWEELNGAKVLLTAQSATSHCLCKILAKKKFKVDSNYEVVAISPEDDFLQDGEAALFIGDNALYLNYHREEGLYYYDLGEQWRQFTGHPMVYALWVTSKALAKTEPEVPKRVHDFVVQGFKQGFKTLEEAINSSAKLKNFSKDILWEYLHLIKWNLGEEQLAGLKLFYAYAQELGLIPEVPELVFVK